MSQKRNKRKERQESRRKELENSRKVTQIFPKSENQRIYFESISNNAITFVSGPAGCGKSFIALYFGLELLMSGQIEKVVIIRPLVEVKNFGEAHLGSLPGSALEKLLPWAGGIFDNAELLIEKSMLERLVSSGRIEFLPLALCRGRTFHNALIICEEAQNISLEGDGLKMILTRIGINSKIVIAGDLGQKDLGNRKSALEDALTRFKNTQGFGVVKLDTEDIMRSPIIESILRKYEQ